MKVLSIIGTRPQYIKVKPVYDYFNSMSIEHYILDSMQHYSDNVSKDLVNDLNLNIRYNVDYKKGVSEIEFISICIKSMSEIINIISPDVILIYGDTNSTFCAAIVANRLGIKVAHIEAGQRSGTKITEELNRIFSDEVSDINFCSSVSALSNVKNGIYSGDLEYELLNSLDPIISHEDFAVMTIHRQSNCSEKRMKKIIEFCSKVGIEIRFYVHHRIKRYLPKSIPENVKLIEPCVYTHMVDNLSKCLIVFTDSGSIQKTLPFFGKRGLVFRSSSEWEDVEKLGYSRLATFTDADLLWLNDKVGRNKRLYLDKNMMSSEIIEKNISKLIGV